jgi:hypothetical protein
MVEHMLNNIPEDLGSISIPNTKKERKKEKKSLGLGL